jgi:hypothetical protein
MAELVVDYALTTKDRIKDRLGITGANFDTLIDRLISAMTDFIEGECNRRFKETTYTNEIYSVYGENPKYIFLKQAPVSSLTSLQYRAGTPSNPNWTNFIVDDYELLEDGKSGIVRIYNLPTGINVVRATYTAGYKIDFANAGSQAHTLPFDISDLCERLVVKEFKKRDAEGKASESFEGGTTNWRELLEEADKLIINRYRRPAPFV